MNLQSEIKDEHEGEADYKLKAKEATDPEAKAVLLAHAQDEHRHAEEDKLVQEGKADQILQGQVGRLPADTPHNSKNLSEINADGSVWVNPKVPENYHGIKLRERVYVYEDAVRKGRAQGWTDAEARKLALEESHIGLSSHQVEVMEGKLGSLIE